MMTYTRSAIGLLTRQYRSVLKKCFLINMGLFALGAVSAQAAAPTPTLDDLSNKAANFTTTSHYTLATTQGSNTHFLLLDNGSGTLTKYWYTPNEDTTEKNNILNYLAGVALVETTGTMGYVFTDGTKYYTFDMLKPRPASSYVLTQTDTPSHWEIDIDGTTYDLTMHSQGTGNQNLYFKWDTTSGNRKLTPENATSVSNDLIVKANGGTGDVSIYYKWMVDANNNWNLTKIDGSAVDYDFVAKYQTAGTTITATGTLKTITSGSTSEDSMVRSDAGVVKNPKASISSTLYLDNISRAYFSKTKNQNWYALAMGGAISNLASTENINITADFVGNHFDTMINVGSTTGIVYAKAIGGAISNSASSGSDSRINTITGDFIGNYISSSSNLTILGGGAIANESYYYNSQWKDTTINSIIGDFVGNYTSGGSTSNGGAIYLYGGAKINSIEGDFVGNYAIPIGETGSLYGQGGAIYLWAAATIGSIKGNFVGNHTSGGYSYGGAIFGSNSNIGLIEGDFVGNYTSGNTKKGGAIYFTSGSIGRIVGNFVGNYSGLGGAIYNYSTINSIVGDFVGNSSGQGGAIYNYSTKINSIMGDFINNQATSNGAAIYVSGGMVTLSGNTFTGNYIQKSANRTPNSIYNAAVINIADGATVTINDGYAGTSSAKLNVGTSAGSGSVFNLSVDNNELQTDNLGKVTNNGTMTWDLDVDFSNATQQSDKITVTSLTGTQSIIINAINLMVEPTSVYTVNVATGGSALANALTIAADGGILKTQGVTQWWDVTYTSADGLLHFAPGEAPVLDNLVSWIAKDEADKAYTIASGGEIVAENLGTLVNNKLTVTGNGETGTNNVVGGNHGGVSLGATTQTLELNNIASWSGFTGDAVTVGSNGTLNISNTNFSGNGTSDVNNGGTMNLSGTNSFESVTGTGTTAITNGTTTVGNVAKDKTLTQGTVTISDSGKLVASNGITTTNSVNNAVANGLEVTGGTINSNVSGDGSTKINTTGTVSLSDGKQISQAVNLAAGTFNSSANGVKGGVAVTAGTVELTGGTLTTNITGSGSTNIKAGTGTVTVSDGSIGNNVTITSGTLASTAAKLGGTITNNATLNLSGDLSKNIGGTAGTTVLQSTTSKVEADRTVSGTLNANGKTIGMKDSSFETLTVGNLKDNGNITLDVDASTGYADRVNITSGANNDAVITITDLNFTKPVISGDAGSYSKQILTGNTTGATLALSTALATPTVTPGLERSGTNDLDTYAIDWDANYGGWTQSGTQTETYTIESSSGTLKDTLKYTLSKAWGAKDYSAGKIENLAAMNAYTGTGYADRSVDFDGIFGGAEAGTYTVASDLGTASAGTYSLNGVKSGTTNTTINLNNHSGFVLANATTLALSNIDMTGNDTLISVSNADAVINLTDTNLQGGIARSGTVEYAMNTSGTSAIKNVTGAKINNAGSLSLSGTNNLVNLTNASGSTTVTAGTTNVGSLTQDAVTVSGGKLVASNGITTTNGVSNAVANGLEVTGGTINSNVSGDGSTKINTTGTVSLSDGKQISQAVNLAAGTFNSSADGIKGGVNVTAGTVELTGGALTTDITGSGSTEIKAGTGTVTVSDGSIGNNVTITSGTLASTAAKLGGTITNNATLNLSGDLSKAVSGNGTTKVDSALTLVSGSSIVGTLDMNNGTLTINGSHDIGQLTGTGSGSISANAATGVISSLDIQKAGSDGTLNITSLAFDKSGLVEGTDYNQTMHVLTGTTGTASVTLDSAIAAAHKETNVDISDLTGTDTVSTNNVSWNDTFGNWKKSRKRNATLAASGTDLVYTVSHVYGDKVYTTNTEGLKELNQFDAGTAVKTFDAATEGSDHTIIENIGTTVGKLSIDGKNGTLDFDNHKGFVVASGAEVSLKDITVKDANGLADVKNGATLNLENATLENNGLLQNAGTINLNGANSIDSIIAGTSTGATLNVNSDWEMDTTVTGHMVNVNGVKLTIGAGKLVASDSLTATSGSDIEIASNKVNLDKVSFKNGSKLNLKVNSLSDFGSVHANNITIENGATLSATLAQGIVKIGQKETLQLLKADNTDFNNFEDTYDNNMYHFEKADTNGAYLISQVKTAEEVVEEAGGTATDARAAAAWVDGDKFEEGSAAAEVADALADLAQNDAKEFNNTMSTIAPKEAPDVQAATTDLSDKLLLTIGKYLSNQDIGGLSSGDVYEDVTLWAKGYYGKSKLSNHKNVRGFDTKNKGVIAGLDKKLTSTVKVGVGFQYNDSDIDSYRQKADVDTLTGFVYGEYRPSKWFVSGVASYGKSDYDEKKYALGKTIKDNYSADIYSLQALTGYDFKYATPEIGARYYRIKRHGYEDTIGQKVSGKDMDLLRGVMGLRTSYEYGMFKPEVYAGITYDFISQKDNAIVSLPNSASYTVAGRRLQRFGTEFSLSVTANVTDQLSFLAGYEGKFRSHYQDHTGMINAKYEF